MKLVPVTFDLQEFWHARYLEAFEWSSKSGIATFYDTTTCFAAPDALWRIAVLDDNTPIGMCGLQHINLIDRCAEASLAIESSFRKQGYGHSLAKLLIEFAFITANMRRLQTTVLPDALSRKLLEATGFELEGTAKAARWRNGEYVDVLHYGLVRSKQWE